MQNLGPRIIIGGHNLNNLRCTNRTVLVAEDKDDLQKLLHIVEEDSSEKGLELNSKKAKVMVVSRNNECLQINIFVNGDEFKILGYLNIKRWTQKH